MAEYTPTESYIEFIKEQEAYGPGQQTGRDGTDHVAYQDEGGTWTIGYGHTKGVKKGDRITDESATAMISGDLQDAHSSARSQVPGFDNWNPNQQDSIVDLYFNVGPTAIAKSQALKNLNKGDWEGWQREANGPEGFNKVTNPTTGLKELSDGLVRRTTARAKLGDTPYEAPPTSTDAAQKPISDAKPAEVDPIEVAATPQAAVIAPPVAPADPEPVNLFTGEGVIDPASPTEAAATRGAFAPARGTPIAPREDQVLPATIRERNTGIEPGVRTDERFNPSTGTEFHRPVRIPRSQTTRERNEAQQSRQEKFDADSENGFPELMRGAFENENAIAATMQAFDGQDWPFDETLDITEQMALNKETIMELNRGGQADEVGRVLGGAQNEEHFQFLLDDLRKKKEWEERLAGAGWKGMGALVPAVLLDFDAAIGFGVGKARKLTRFGSILKGGAYAAGTGGSIEAYLALNNPYRDINNVGFAAAGGLVLGGAFGALGHKSNARWQKLADDMAKDELDRDVSHLMTRYDQGDRDFTPEQWEKIQAEDTVDTAKSAGAAERVLGKSEETGDVDLVPGARKAVAELDEVETAPEFRWQWMQKAQANIQGKLFGSLSQTMKDRSARIIEGGFIVDKKATRAFTAEGRGNNLMQTMSTRMFRESEAPFKAWAEKNGYGTIQREVGIEANENFYTEVGKAMQGNTDAAISKEARQAASQISKQMDEIHAMAREAGLPGFVNAEPLENFLPRSWQRQKMTEIFDQVDDEVLGKWFSEAMARNIDEIDADLQKTLDNVGIGFVTAIRRQTAGMDDMLMHGIPTDDLERLHDLFRGIDIDDEVANELIRRLGASADKEGGSGVKHGKQRLRIDETFDGLVKKRDGTSMRLTLDQMTNTDAGKVVPRYFRVMSGWIGLAQEAGIKSDADVDNLVRVMQAEGATAAEVTAFKESIRLVTGRSIEENVSGLGSQASRIALGYNYTRQGGSFGIAQVPEMGNIIAEVGVRQFIKNIPEIRSMLKRMENGEIENELARELEEIVAAGTDWINGAARSNFGDMGEEFTHESLKKLDGVLQRGGRLTQAMSLMGPINTFLERMAVYDISQDWAQLARKASDKIPEAKKARLRAAGLSDEMQEQVFEQIRKHATFNEKTGQMTNINIKDWTDNRAADSYGMAMDRQRRFVIQRNDIGNTGSYIHKPMGRILTQFMSFMLNSINKQLLRNVHHNDIQTWVGFTTTTFFGGLAYMFQTSIDYGTNKKEFKKRMAPEMIATAAFQRSGWSSIIPPLIDTSVTLGLGRDPLFAHGRTSGLGASIITGNSTVTGVQDILATATLPLRLLQDDYSLSQQDTKRIKRLIPGQRLLGVSNGFHAIDEVFNLPKSSKSQ